MTISNKGTPSILPTTTPADWPAIVPASEGWMTNIEVACVAFACVATRHAGVGGGVLEIGCFLGRTTSALALVADTVDVVDTFVGEESLETPAPDFYGRFAINMDARMAHVRTHRGLSRDVLPTRPGPWRVALIDGDHSEEAAYGDIMAVWPNVSVGGYMFIDDVNWNSVAKAVDRWAGTIAGGTAIYAAISGKLGVMRKLA